MELKSLTHEQIQDVFSRAGLRQGKIEKVEVGFSNDVYEVGGEYIFKSGRTTGDDEYLHKEIYICNLLKDKVPTPSILHFDTSKQLTDRIYIIYEKIQGDNLYMKWHEYTTDQRKSIIRQICSFLRIINDTPYEEYAKKFGINTTESWRESILSKIKKHNKRVAKQGSLEPELLIKIEEFAEKHADVLNESKMALTYFDVHFDNFIVQEDKVVGMLDFERTDVLSIDYVLDTAQRMVNQPTKYASEMAEKLVNPKDYAHLMEWYKEYYPELFQFPEMAMRLRLYAIQYDLQQRYYWKDTESLRIELTKNVTE